MSACPKKDSATEEDFALGAYAPLVSVITPTCNRPDLLPREFDSLLGQSYQNFEVVLGDDNEMGSEHSARVQEVVEDYRAKGLAITYFKTEGKIGAGKVRNLAATRASGDYFVFLDDDDEFFPDKLKDQLTFTISVGADISYHDATWFNEEGELVEYRRLNYSKSESKQDLLRKHLLYHIAPGTTYMISRTAFFATRGWGDVKVGQDWHLMLDCIENDGISVRYFPGMYVKQHLFADHRLSLGMNKIDGENALYQVKKERASQLSFLERRYVAFRHYAVLAFASKRSGMRGRAAAYALAAVLSSPYHCAVEARNYFSDDRSIGM